MPVTLTSLLTLAASLGGVVAASTLLTPDLRRRFLSRPLKDLFRFETMPFAGREIVYTAHVSRNVSPMFVGEDSAFADAGNQGHVQVRVGQRKLMARVRMKRRSSPREPTTTPLAAPRR